MNSNLAVDRRRSEGVYFYWCSGQEDNIGDVALRRSLYHALESQSDELVHIYVGRSSDSFVESLELGEKVWLYRSKAAWLQALIRSEKSPTIIFDPGEMRLDESLVSQLALLPFQAFSCLRGGRSVKLGISVRTDLASSPAARGVFRVSTRLASSVVWRDVTSARSFGGGTVGCDWAFAESDPSLWREDEDGSRTIFAVCARNDRPLWSPLTVDAIADFCATHGLRPVVFVQVRRDNERAKALAGMLGADLVDWPEDVGHREQEATVRELMRHSVAVAGDRLHALIIGAGQGAVPIGLTDKNDSKISGHLDAIGLFGFSRVTSELTKRDLQEFLAWATASRSTVAAAMSRTTGTVAEMASLLAGAK
ncbi:MULTISPECIES: polysaccharide pyruvyl transferase family protein [unclassified Gordonia (in: high G+C Gram-positive bacteria)]|uniref:polysaccharide pyruvyl transferase family protein n=1 Tax=unclassified Gordonia (in: high G+C Gram-positive bacteria) TaxID=2657482 RepID=UPI0019631127|nr:MULTISPECIES: polysaccharide pyruvyl transferase family protein [unclassified Gordonia (in: high G+C Gram-positive bacteria)]MBN0974523.1 polysaccharide pyruvyl transferase family protein [Gordonia sp. BP-119]MBN0984471.1 polysaccharide pyruvyl transferase family protein [Gordonia sp. BP-94]